MKHNNQISNNHFRKHWQANIKTWFNQPARKLRRSINRKKKAVAIAPRPADGALRPAVHCPTIKYFNKMRLGKGFSLGEIKLAGLGKLYARSIGIAVDHRRRSISQSNVARLQTYLSKLVVIKKDNKEAFPQVSLKNVMPIERSSVILEEPRAMTEEEKNSCAFAQRRQERSAKRYAGRIAKKRAAKAEREASNKK